MTPSNKKGLFERPFFLRARWSADDVHHRAPGLRLELDLAVGLGEQGVVAAHADVDAGMELRAALAHQDVAGDDALAAELLEAEALGLRIAAVTGTAACFFMCHGIFAGLAH